MPGQTPSKLSVDFSNVEERREGGKAAHVPEGDYLLQVRGITLESKKDDSSSKYLKWRFGIFEPKKFSTAGLVYHNTSLKPEALWNLRNLLEDLGIKVPKSIMGIPLSQIVERKMIVGATLADGEPYNGKVRSEIVATFKKDQFEAAASSESEESEDEASTEETEEDVEELDVDDL